jgi:hypothetical protein
VLDEAPLVSTSARAARRAAVIAAAFACFVSGCESCRKEPAAGGGGDAGGGGGPEEAASVDGGYVAPAEGRHRFRDAEPNVDAAAAAIDPACTGKLVDLAAAVVDPRCAIGSAEAKRLREPFEVDGGAPLEQQLARDADGRLVVRVTNTGSKPLALPLSYHSKLPAFTAMAETETRELYELEAPRLDASGDGRAHIARVVVPPGGVAFARPVLSTKVSTRIVPSCAGGAPCGSPSLPAGKYVLYVGQLVIDVEAGAPARIEWTVP